MKKVQAAALMAIVYLLLLPAVVAAAQRVQAGQWETTMQVGSGAPLKSKSCISSAEADAMNGDAATLRNYVEASTATNTAGRCAVTDAVVQGQRTVITMRCGKTEVVGTTDYQGDRYESSSSNGTTLSGTRVGDCP